MNKKIFLYLSWYIHYFLPKMKYVLLQWCHIHSQKIRLSAEMIMATFCEVLHVSLQQQLYNNIINTEYYFNFLKTHQRQQINGANVNVSLLQDNDYQHGCLYRSHHPKIETEVYSISSIFFKLYALRLLLLWTLQECMGRKRCGNNLDVRLLSSYTFTSFPTTGASYFQTDSIILKASSSVW